MVGPGVLEHRACSDHGENARLPKPEEGSGGRGCGGGLWVWPLCPSPCCLSRAPTPGLHHRTLELRADPTGLGVQGTKEKGECTLTAAFWEQADSQVIRSF